MIAEGSKYAVEEKERCCVVTANRLKSIVKVGTLHGSYVSHAVTVVVHIVIPTMHRRTSYSHQQKKKKRFFF